MEGIKKYFWTKALLLVIFCVIQVDVQAQGLNTAESDSVLVERFIDIYEREGVKASMDFLYSSNPWMGDAEGAKEKLEELVLKFGELYGFELIKKARLNNRYSVFSYLLLYERQPLRFSFILYRPDEKWRFQSFRYDNDLEEEMINSTVVSWDF